MRGHVDNVTHLRVEGWAWDPVDPDGIVMLGAYDNGIAIGEFAAEHFRQDLSDRGFGSGRHGFIWMIPGGLSSAIAHMIEVRRVSDGWKLPGWNRLLPADPAAAATMTPLRGCLDICDRNIISGWAWDSAKPDRPITLQILSGRTVIARVTANRHREDLQQQNIGDGRHAFQLRIPGGLPPLVRHVIRVRDERDAREIPGSPRVLEPSNSFDPALEEVIGEAVGALAADAEQERALAFLAGQTERLLQKRAEADGRLDARSAFREYRWRGRTEVNCRAESIDPGLRALVIDDVVPDTTRDAGSHAILSHMRALQEMDYAVSFAAAHEHPLDRARIAILRTAGFSYLGTPFYASIEEVMKRQRNCFDLIYLHRLSSAQKYLALARQYNPRARILYSVADLHHIRVARQADIEERQELRALSRRLRLAECTAAFQADAVLTHSVHEPEMMRLSVPEASIYVAPWAVPARPVVTPFAKRRGVGMIAGYQHTPNVDAACYLVQEVMPLVWDEDPDIPCLLAGSAMPDIVKDLAGPNVEVVGQIFDLAELLEQVRLTAALLRYGAGVKGKVLDSWAAGIPCVMTDIAAEGLRLPPDLDRLVGTDAATLAALILRTHRDEAFAARASRAGLALMAREFTGEAVVAALHAAIHGLQAEPRSHGDRLAVRQVG